MTDVVALAAELLAIPSLSGSEKAVVDFVSRWLVARGWNVTVQEVSKGRGNVWASRGGAGGATREEAFMGTKWRDGRQS